MICDWVGEETNDSRLTYLGWGMFGVKSTSYSLTIAFEGLYSNDGLIEEIWLLESVLF